MEITRREMIVTASAIGVSAALAQVQAQDTVPKTDPPPDEWSSDDVVADHYDKAAHRIVRTAPSVFGSFTGRQLEKWARDDDGEQIKGRRVRGYYKEGEDDDEKHLRYVYAFSHDENNGAYTDYRFLAIGCAFRAKDIKKSAQEAIEAIVYDLQHQESFYMGSSKANFNNIPAEFMNEKSFLSLMLRYLAKKQATMEGVDFTENDPPTSWKLTITRLV